MAICSFLVLGSCSKNAPETGADNCAKVSSVSVTRPANTNMAVGDTLKLNANSIDAVSYNWVIPGEQPITTATGKVDTLNFTNEGWVYFTATNSCNQVKKDSFYLDISLPQGNPSCSLTDNFLSLTAENHSSGALTTVGFEESVVQGTFGASGGKNELDVQFHTAYGNNNLPEEGIYTTGTFVNNLPKFGAKDFDKVFIVLITYSPTTIYYKSVPGQKVYVKRVNGKLKVSICDMALQGSSQGVAYNTNMSVSATAQ